MSTRPNAQGRAARLRSVADSIKSAPITASGTAAAQERAVRAALRTKLMTLARQADAVDVDWDEDADHLAQAVDAILDSALEAFQNDEVDQGVALVVGAEATVDELLKVMNLVDADEADHQPAPSVSYSKSPNGTVRHEQGSRAVDNSAWDGSAAMSSCAKSSTPGSCYSSICAGRKSGPADQQSSWALPHHKSAGGPPNAAGVTAALGRLNQTQGLTNSAAARAHLEAHQRAIQGSQSNSAQKPGYERRNNLVVRAIQPGYELREASDGDGMPVLAGHFAVFNRWAEIDSFWEGQFMESIAPGAFKRTFQNDRAGMRVLFQHGRDPVAGNKPLGPIDTLEEDGTGARYEVPLLDASYVRDLLPGLRAGLYGASFRFRVMKEQLTEKPERSDHNPDGIPERVIQEAQVQEFGPVTFPAYAEATAGIRSLTDEYILQQFGMDPERLHELLHHFQPAHATALPEGHDDARSSNGTRDDSPKRLAVIRNPNRRR